MDDDCNCPPEGAPAWMATFGDLMSLLLTFFVLLLSMAQIDKVQAGAAFGSIREALGSPTMVEGQQALGSDNPMQLITPPNGNDADEEREAELKAELEKMVDDADLGNSVEVMTSDRGVTMRLKEGVLFKSGSDDIVDEGREVLLKLRQVAERFGQGLVVEGHTDDRPIKSSRFPSNWELSTGRAAAALRVMQADGPLKVSSLQVSGFADSKPIAPNDSDENRGKNRRVEFVFERPNGDGRPIELDAPQANSAAENTPPAADAAPSAESKQDAPATADGPAPSEDAAPSAAPTEDALPSRDEAAPPPGPPATTDQGE